MDIQDVIQWLQEGEEWDAAELLAQCEFQYHHIDTMFPLDGGPDIDMVALDVQAPRRILDRLSDKYTEQTELIEKAVRELAQANHCHVRDISWVAKTGKPSSLADSETELVLATLDSNHVRYAWNKALSRRETDPEGAITSAKTLVEAVCKQLLNRLEVKYPPNQDINSLYCLVAEQLNLSPRQHVDSELKRMLGHCMAIVSGIAFLRNQLGDAHSREPGEVMTSKADAELAVNLAGAMATFLVKSSEKGQGDANEANAPG